MTPVDRSAKQALNTAASVGPYFAMNVDHGTDSAWRPFTELVEPRVLRENVAMVRTVLAERAGRSIDEFDLRACASTFFLGLAARVIAPPLGALVLTGAVVQLELGRLRWQRVTGGPMPIAIDDPKVTEGDVYHAVIEPVMAPLADAFASTFALSPQVLWGNVASAIAGATTMLRTVGPEVEDPLEVARELSSHGRLARMGQWRGGRFTRNNCCLFYRLPSGGKCSDCVLLATRATRQ